MNNLYEGMFLLDNDLVRKDWGAAKAVVTGTLEKHGGEVVSSRRWDERRLAYPIRHKRRGTYLLAYFRAPNEELPNVNRDLELNEGVLRYLLLSVDDVPSAEIELSRAEEADDFRVPPPPDDDAADESEAVEEPDEDVPRRGRGRSAPEDEDSGSSDDDDENDDESGTGRGAETGEED